MISDEQIFKDVTSKLSNDSRIDSTNITVGVKKNIVTLTGSVKSFLEKSYAEEDVKSVKGVLGLAEELDVNFFGNAPPNDSDIVKACIEALKWDLDLTKEENKVQIVAENGIVTLTGNVDYHFQKRRALDNIRYIKGVKKVLNKLTINKVIMPSNLKNKIIEGFVKNARIDGGNINVEVNGREVILKGKVRSWAEHEEAKKIAYSVPGVTSVQNLIRLEAS